MVSEIEKTGLRVNMGKTRIMVSGLDLDLLKKSGKDQCGGCQKGVGSNCNLLWWLFVLDTQEMQWHQGAPCALTLISGAPVAWVQHGLLMEEQ